MISRTILNIFLLIVAVSAEFYTSLESLKTINGAERDIPVMIEGYLEKEFAQKVQERNDKIKRNGWEAIRHPINLSIKGIITDWNEIVKIMLSNSADDAIHNLTHQRANMHFSYPTEEDLLGAATGLLRLQDTYQMNTKDIADGKILNSRMPTVALTAEDCFEIGRAAYCEYDYYHTIIWMQEARERVEKKAIPTVILGDILEYLAFSLYKQGNLKRALLLTDELFRMDPNHPRAKKSVRRYENLLEYNGVQQIDMRRDIPPINNIRKNNLDEGGRLMYEALCRQEVPIVSASPPCV